MVYEKLQIILEGIALTKSIEHCKILKNSKVPQWTDVGSRNWRIRVYKF